MKSDSSLTFIFAKVHHTKHELEEKLEEAVDELEELGLSTEGLGEG